MSVFGSVRAAVRNRLISRAGGVDLTKLDKVPDRLAWPLKRIDVDPVPRLGETRDRAPVSRLATFLGLDIWLVTGDPEVREVLGDTSSYSTDIRPLMGTSGAADGDIGGLGFTDPPEHTRLRKVLTPEFTMRRLARLKPGIDAIIDRLLAETEAGAAANGGVVDLAQTFCFPLPFLVICDLLGLPDDRREHFRSLASARFDVSLGGSGTIGAISGSREFLLGEAARQRKDPGPGLIGQIIREHGDTISDYDLGGLADGVFTGGLETSASMLALGTAVLLRDQALWRRLATDPTCAEPVVEDLLRYLSVVQVAFPRFAKEDVVVAGQRIKRGSVLLASLPAANRDPRTTAGDVLDTDRAKGSHLAFGYGFHRCVGAELARMELRAAYPALAARFPEMSMASEGLDYHDMSIVYGLDDLPVRLT